MTCDLVKQQIDLYVFEKESQSLEEVADHLRSCSSCNDYFEVSKRAGEMMRKIKDEPFLDKPSDFTEKILIAIDDIDKPSKKQHSAVLALPVRILAAASISLLLIFGIEQYVVVDKILKSEAYVARISIKPNQSNFSRIKLLNTTKYLHAYRGFLLKNHTVSFTQEFHLQMVKNNLSALNLSIPDIQYYLMNMPPEDRAKAIQPSGTKKIRTHNH